MVARTALQVRQVAAMMARAVLRSGGLAPAQQALLGSVSVLPSLGAGYSRQLQVRMADADLLEFLLPGLLLSARTLLPGLHAPTRDACLASQHISSSSRTSKDLTFSLGGRCTWAQG